MAAPSARTGKSPQTPKSGLPPYNTALGKFLALPADVEQTYSDVVTQVFPLKANLARLQKFCDGYLNMSGDPPVRFKAAAPWVLMQVCDYGKMCSTSENLGWFSQHELAFGVPLEWYIRENSKWVFVDWVMVFPFIFVDSPFSMSGGRQVYGWAKAAIQIDATPAIFEPGNAHQLVSISLMPAGMRAGERPGPEEFLQIFQRRPFMSAKSAVSDLVMAVPKALAGSVTAAYSLLEMAGLPPFGSVDRDVKSLDAMTSRFYGRINALAPEAFRAPAPNNLPPSGQNPKFGIPPFNIITMKQFRDVRSATSSCFQALVGSKMQIDQTTDGGYLYDPLAGDPTGGISINLVKIGAQPIVDALGLESTEHASVNGAPASTLRPLMPFWSKMDLRYGLADYQCWRTDTTEWALDDKPKPTPRREIPYVTLGSGAREEVGGPYTFPRFTMRVLPLRADTRTLQQLIDRYLENDFFEFAVAGRCSDRKDESVVCLIASNFDSMTAATDPDNSYSDRELTFAVPVSWHERGSRDAHPAMIPLYGFVGSYWNAVTNFEVHGRLALKSTLIDPDAVWLAEPSATVGKLLLTAKTELFPELGKTQEAQEVAVVEFYSESAGAGTRGSITNYLNTLGLAHFWSGDQYHTIALKQIGDAKDFSRADYQALVGLSKQFTGRNGHPQPECGTLHSLSINVYNYPTLPIVETLGLKSERVDKSGPCPRYTLKPVDPFWISGAMNGDAGEDMCWRVGNIEWRQNPRFRPDFHRGTVAKARKSTSAKRKKNR